MGYSFFHYEQPNQTRRMFYCGRGYRCAFRTAGAGVGYRHEPSREQPDGGDRRATNFRRNVPDVPRRRGRRRCRPRRPRVEHNRAQARRWRRRPLPHDTPGGVGHADAAVQGASRRAGVAARQLHPHAPESRSLARGFARRNGARGGCRGGRSVVLWKGRLRGMSRDQRTRWRHRSRLVERGPAHIGCDPPEDRVAKRSAAPRSRCPGRRRWPWRTPSGHTRREDARWAGNSRGAAQ